MTDTTQAPESATTSNAVDTAEATAVDIAKVSQDAKDAIENLVKFSRIPTEQIGLDMISALHTLIDTVLGK